MAHKVRSLKDGLVDIFTEAKGLGIKPVKVAARADHGSNKRPSVEEEQLRFRREHVDCEGIIGRDRDRETIISLLCDEDNRSQHLSVIGIYGMAGLGKTTICRDIFNTPKVKAKFDYHIWITVSYDFEPEQLPRQMADQVVGIEASTNISIEVIKRKLKERLEGKKYLLVLDDIWDTFKKAWEPFRNLLQEMRGSEGTTLLATSRSKVVLEKLLTHKSDGMRGIENPCIHELEKLTEPQSWNLFRQRVGDDEGLKDPVKENVAECLLNRCDGVPLAIITLGDLLRSRKEAQEWVTISKSEIWNENDSEIMPSVKLSFNYLSSTTLKRCFVFCGNFREDEIIEKDRLIQLWMANGLLQSYDDGGDAMEQVGEQYINELLSNSLFQDTIFTDLFGKVFACKMHDVVHKLARDILKQESSLPSSSSVFETISVNGVQRCLGEQVSSNKVRTLLLFGKCERFDEKVRLLDFKCLRALSLVDLGLKELPDSIGMLKHLRYLDISLNSAIQSLPDELTKLHQLQTIRMIEIGEIPRFLREISEIPRFLREISKLVNLRHLYCGQACMGIPEGLGMLSHVQTLPEIDLKMDWGGSLRELKTLNLFKKIALMNLQEANKEEAIEANLGSKQNIEHLKLSWGDDDDGGESNSRREEDKKILDVLQPHPNLSSLIIIGYRANTLSEWVLGMKVINSQALSSLIYLEIRNCEYMTCLPDVRGLTCLRQVIFRSCKNVSRLEQLASIFDLPKLQELWLGEYSAELDTIFPPIPCRLTTPLSKSLHFLSLYGDGMKKVESVPHQIQYLLALQKLFISSFQSVEEIPEWLSKLTSLKQLHLLDIANLKRLPSANAMQQLTQLTHIYIQDCPIMKRECAKESGPQWPNIQHIPNVYIQ